MLKELRIKRKWLPVFLSILIVLSSLAFSALTALALEGTDTEAVVYATESEENPKTLLETPIISSVSNTVSGVNINWGAVKGAEKYRVYYRIGSGDWYGIGETTSTSYTWTGAKSGTKYTFTVRCISSDGTTHTSDFDHTGKNLDYIAAPKLLPVYVNNYGIVISWDTVAGAKNYGVYYKTDSENWTKLGNTTSTSYTWTSAKFGTKYSFTVRCISADGKSYASSFDSTGQTITALKAPTISSVSNGANGVNISWGKVSGAEKYKVFRKTGNGSWVSLGNADTNSFVDKTAVSGNTYFYTIRSLTASGNAFTSGFDTVGKSVKYIAAPKLLALDFTNTGIKITWGKVTGAGKYGVYYKTDSGNWTKLADTTSTSYIWTGPKNGNKYSFTVRCISSDGKSFISDFDPTGMAMEYLSIPKLTSLEATATGVKINWGNVNGAVNYRVFYKIGNGSWTKIGDTTSTSFTWTGAKIGTKYSFTVRSFNSDGTKYTSWYDSAGLSINYVSTPKITSASNTNSGVQLNWGKVTGAEKYRVYYKNSSGVWTKIGETTSTSYTWTGAKSGTKYTFTVRCISSDGKTFASSFDSTGETIQYIATPKLTSVEAVATGVKITWGKVDGAADYRVFYKIGNGNWIRIADTTATSYTWTEAKSNTKYTFTVRCVSSDGKLYTSSFDSTGKSLKFISAPQLTSIAAGSKGITMYWNKVAGAELYKVFRKTANGSWTSIGVTAYTDFTDMQAKKGTTYSYTVRCVNSSQSEFTSGFDTVGKTATSISNPPTKNDMVAIAESQLGITGGKKYWSWAGYSSRVPWCNIFVTWCADQLGYYQSGRIPLIQWPRDSVKWFKERGLFKDKSYIPKPGDLIYFAYYGENEPYHIGIVEKYQNGKVYTIEGNAMDVVKKKTFDHGDRIIFGYATPDYGHN